MPEERPDKRETTAGGGSSGVGDAPPSFQEQQAIAAARMLGEQMRRDDRSQAYFYTQRIALFISVLAFLAMIMLYTYARLRGGDFNPILGVVFLGLIMAGGASVSYWAAAELRRAKED